jgi:membrane protease YdiL (CAAX protease family)
MSSNRGLSPKEAGFDVGMVILAICVAWGASRLLVYPALSIPDNAPVILRPICGFFAAWALLRWRGSGWRALGLRKPRVVWIAVLGAIALYLVNMVLAAWVAPQLAQWITPVQQPSFMGPLVRGNTAMFATWLAIGIVVGGFMEECLFRGFLLTRVAEALGGGGAALATGVVAQALLFGALHLYGGVFAFMFAALAALASGVGYLVLGRNLWPLIAVHAAWNSVAIWGIYTS